MNADSQEIHEAVLKVVRSALATKERRGIDDNINSWIDFIEMIVMNLCFGDQGQPSDRQQREELETATFL